MFSSVSITAGRNCELHTEITYEVSMPLFHAEDAIKLIGALRDKLKDKFEVATFQVHIEEIAGLLVKSGFIIEVYNFEYDSPSVAEDLTKELDAIVEPFLPEGYWEDVAEANKHIKKLI